MCVSECSALAVNVPYSSNTKILFEKLFVRAKPFTYTSIDEISFIFMCLVLVGSKHNIINQTAHRFGINNDDTIVGSLVHVANVFI